MTSSTLSRALSRFCTRLGPLFLGVVPLSPHLMAPPARAADDAEGALESAQQVTFEAADGVTIFADTYRADDAKRPWLILFHQAGANARAEYGPLIPRLLGAGFRILAIDQRNGGSRLGGRNRTLDALPKHKSYSYCDAYPDLEAALRYVRRRDPKSRPIIWGSSYSAALVIRLGAEHPDELRAVLAFSPAAGSPMGDCQPGPYAAKLKIPAMALRPASEMKSPRSREQLKHFAALGLRTYVADPGVHGSSMLNAARVGGNVEATWKTVLEFLDEVTHQKG